VAISGFLPSPRHNNKGDGSCVNREREINDEGIAIIAAAPFRLRAMYWIWRGSDLVVMYGPQ
jgi:hypothetical protein